MFYQFMRGIAKLIILFPRRVRFEGLENIPQDGAVVFVSNHCHGYDPVLMALATDREVSFLGKEELFKGKFLSWFFRKIKVIPLDRSGADRTAIKQAIGVLKDGEILGVFPEGTRSKDGNLLPFKSGVCFIASQAPCVILPMAICYEGTSLFRYFGKPVIVRVGKSFPYEGKEGEKRKETQQRMLKEQENAVFQLLHGENKLDVK